MKQDLSHQSINFDQVTLIFDLLQGLTNRFFRYLPKDRLERENHLPYHKTYLPYLNKDKRYYLFLLSCLQGLTTMCSEWPWPLTPDLENQ